MQRVETRIAIQIGNNLWLCKHPSKKNEEVLQDPFVDVKVKSQYVLNYVLKRPNLQDSKLGRYCLSTFSSKRQTPGKELCFMQLCFGIRYIIEVEIQ